MLSGIGSTCYPFAASSGEAFPDAMAGHQRLHLGQDGARVVARDHAFRADASRQVEAPYAVTPPTDHLRVAVAAPRSSAGRGGRPGTSPPTPPSRRAREGRPAPDGSARHQQHVELHRTTGGERALHGHAVHRPAVRCDEDRHHAGRVDPRAQRADAGQVAVGVDDDADQASVGRVLASDLRERRARVDVLEGDGGVGAGSPSPVATSEHSCGRCSPAPAADAP